MPLPTDADFRAVADGAHGIEAWIDTSGRLRWINPSIERVTGHTVRECLEAPDLIGLLVYDKDRAFAWDQARAVANGAPDGNVELRLQCRDGTLTWVEAHWRALHDDQGALLGTRISAAETRRRKEAEFKLLDMVAELRRTRALQDHFITRSNEERARLAALLDVMKVGVLFMDHDHRVLFCNKPFMRIWGFDENDSLTGVRDAVLTERTLSLRMDDAQYRQHVQSVLATKHTSQPYEFELIDGRIISDISTPVPGHVPGTFIGRVWIYEDVTEQKRIARRLIELAERDPLTGLYNRRRFMQELDRMIADASRRRNYLGLLAIDLDGFKPINDTFGHQAGDEVLKAIATEVGGTIRRNEIFFRIGGDEFAILAPDSTEEHLVRVARRVCAKIAHLRFEFEGREARLTASLGIAIYPDHAADAEQLIARGDAAMYEAKLRGKNAWRVYSPDLQIIRGR